MSTIIFDIETGPQPWADIEQFYIPPDPLPDFDPAAVRLGNASKPETVAKKIEEAKAEWERAKAAEPADREAHRQAWLDTAPLDPVIGRIVAVGYKRDTNVRIDGRHEPDILLRFWEIFRKQAEQRGRMVGHNIFGFDLPFILRRSWILGIKVPADVLDKHRYWHPVFVDTMQVWGCGKYGDHSKLDTLARAFGVGTKTDASECTGAMFWKLWSGTPEEHDRAEAYLKNDLEITAGVAMRLGVA